MRRYPFLSRGKFSGQQGTNDARCSLRFLVEIRVLSTHIPGAFYIEPEIRMETRVPLGQ